MPQLFDDPFAFVRTPTPSANPTKKFVENFTSSCRHLTASIVDQISLIAWKRTKVVGMVSLTVGALIVGVAIPAAAFEQNDYSSAEPVVTMTIEGAPQPSVPKMIYKTSHSVAPSAVARDGYVVNYTPPPPPPPLPPSPALFNRSDSFTNDLNGTIQWPFAYGVRLSDGYGSRPQPCEGCSTNHMGQDFDAGTGAPIQAIADGIVTKVEHLSGGLGTYVQIRHQIDGDIIDSVYGHMIADSPMVAVGDEVHVAQQIGLVGNTGASTGAHLHFEIHVNGNYVDPFLWMKAHAN